MAALTEKMNYNKINSRVFLYFSNWSRRGYSIFVSLGREIKIARLSLHMYLTVLLKSSAKGLIINTAHISKVVLQVLKKEFQEAFASRTKGEVCPGVNNFPVNGGGYIA